MRTRYAFAPLGSFPDDECVRTCDITVLCRPYVSVAQREVTLFGYSQCRQISMPRSGGARRHHPQPTQTPKYRNLGCLWRGCISPICSISRTVSPLICVHACPIPRAWPAEYQQSYLWYRRSANPDKRDSLRQVLQIPQIHANRRTVFRCRSASSHCQPRHWLHLDMLAAVRSQRQCLTVSRACRAPARLPAMSSRLGRAWVNDYRDSVCLEFLPTRQADGTIGRCDTPHTAGSNFPLKSLEVLRCHCDNEPAFSVSAYRRDATRARFVSYRIQKERHYGQNDCFRICREYRNQRESSHS